MKEKTLQVIIEEILYRNIIGDSDPDIPKDEYSPEAKRLIDGLATDLSVIDEDYLRERLSQIFSEMFEDDYSPEMFSTCAKEILINLRSR